MHGCVSVYMTWFPNVKMFGLKAAEEWMREYGLQAAESVERTRFIKDGVGKRKFCTSMCTFDMVLSLFQHTVVLIKFTRPREYNSALLIPICS